MAKPNEVKLAADVIRRVLDAAERGDIEFLNYMRAAVRKRPGESKAGQTPKQESFEMPKALQGVSQEHILSEIGRFSSERSLETFLREKYPTKTELVSVARVLHIPTPKTDDYEALAERVIASTLGYKMRSQAVRGAQTSSKRNDPDGEV